MAGRPSVGDMLTALMAAGMSPEDAFFQAWACLGAHMDYDGAWEALAGTMGRDRGAMGFFDRVAERDADAANGLLGAWLASGVLDRMGPLVISLHLDGISWVRRLPAGLRMEGDLCLRDCAGLASLPGGLSVGGYLDLRGCHAWDGIIPDDARIDGVIHAEGLDRSLTFSPA